MSEANGRSVTSEPPETTITFEAREAVKPLAELINSSPMVRVRAGVAL